MSKGEKTSFRMTKSYIRIIFISVIAYRIVRWPIDLTRTSEKSGNIEAAK